MLVRIIQGTYGCKTNGSLNPVRQGETCEVPTAEAKRLFDLGVAEEVGISIAEPVEDKVIEVPFAMNEPEEPEPVEIDYDSLMEKPLRELRTIATEMGIPAYKYPSKEKLINAIKGAGK